MQEATKAAKSTWDTTARLEKQFRAAFEQTEEVEQQSTPLVGEQQVDQCCDDDTLSEEQRWFKEAVENLLKHGRCREL